MKTLHESLNYKPTELSFATSGLRGLVTDITDLEAYINTAGFIDYLAKEQGLPGGSKVYIAGDLRNSTPRILKSVCKAIKDSGMVIGFGGFVPSPALCYFGLVHGLPSIMVTGSHIPDDRNGIKFNKIGGEVLKEDEPAIVGSINNKRADVYSQCFESSDFDTNGALKSPGKLPAVESGVADEYIRRYTNAFSNQPLKNRRIVFYQHSAVGRDMIPGILKSLGADVESVDRSDKFVPIDTENVTLENRDFFINLHDQNPDAFAIISTDGDSDRPFVVDENGIFHRGDELGAVVAKWLKIDFAAYPISTNDAVDEYLDEACIKWEHTKIGSPYVIKAMNGDDSARNAGWEVNGGFLLGSDMNLASGTIKSLPTRDAVLPIIVALVAAIDKSISLSQLFDELPKRYTQAGLIDNFPVENARKMVDKISNSKTEIELFFDKSHGFSQVKSINNLDGVRIIFDNGDIAHIRQSGTAPQLRTYSVANSQQRADEIVSLSIAEPDGILRTIEKSLSS